MTNIVMGEKLDPNKISTYLPSIGSSRFTHKIFKILMIFSGYVLLLIHGKGGPGSRIKNVPWTGHSVVMVLVQPLIEMSV